MTRDPAQDDIERLFNSVRRARLHLDIWYVFKNQGDRTKYTDVMNDYEWFFRPSLGAHFNAMVMEIGTLLDSRRKCVSIYKVVREMRKRSKFTKEAEMKLREKLKIVKPLLDKVLKIRHNVIAHMSAETDPYSAFEKASISANMFRNLINTIGEILELVGKSAGLEFPGFLELGGDDARDVLEKLRISGGKNLE